MTSRVRVRPRALADLEELAVWFGGVEPRLAHRFLAGALATLERLAHFPNAGAPHSCEHGWLRGTRRARVDGFERVLVFYRVVAGSVEVLRVLDGARDLPGLASPRDR